MEMHVHVVVMMGMAGGAQLIFCASGAVFDKMYGAFLHEQRQRAGDCGTVNSLKGILNLLTRQRMVGISKDAENQEARGCRAYAVGFES